MNYKHRIATINDVPHLSVLSEQLGYAASNSEIHKRLVSMLSSDDHIIHVALTPNDEVVGWIHVFESKRLESGSFAEIGGFIITETHRRKGVGRMLLGEAQKWAMHKKLTKLRVRSNIKREDAKEFYSNMGFVISKEQSVFDKNLP